MDQRPSIKPVPFFLVTGFLGSGKTTLLKRFINEYADVQKIAVIQNEFAEANVDGKELKMIGKSFELLEINKGSVFCVCLLSDFVSSLKNLLEICRPDAVILEATGLADPITIGQLLTADELSHRTFLSHVWCIVDTASFLQMESTVSRMAHQVRIADTVVLNKTDQASTEVINRVEKRIIALNPHTEIIQSEYCDVVKQDLFKEITPTPIALKGGSDVPNQVSCGPPTVASAVIKTTRRISEKSLQDFLRQYEAKVYRIKGYVNLSDNSTVSVQSCFGQTTILAVKTATHPTELIALGPALDNHEFREDFLKGTLLTC
ncbi:GTP-binding protein [bacterium]|nr:GTP-binding protein [bacterium]